MKVVTLLGSPRVNGNTATLAKVFNETAEKLGADVQTFMLNNLVYKGCQACEICKTKLDRCVIKDDLAPILESVKHADILVLATPVYFADVSSQLKTFVDRCYSYLNPYQTVPDSSRLEPGKKMVFIITQNHPNGDFFTDISTKYSQIFQLLGFQDNYLIRGCDLLAVDDLRTKNREDLIDLTKETAQKLIK